MQQPRDGVSIRAWKPPIEGIREVFHARFRDHAYPRHTHDAWTLFIVDEGAIRYDLDGHTRGADPSMASILPPHVVHDGRPATADGFRNRVVYLEPDVLGEALVGQAVDRPVIPDPSLRRQVSLLNDALECRDDLLEAETRLAFVAERIRASFGTPTRGSRTLRAGRRELADELPAYLDAHVFETVTMAEAARLIETPATQLARAFVAAFRIAPHTYLLGRRLDAARDRILGGQPLADVAAELGFVDQAHLTRRFKQFLGTTPGRFARS